MAGWITLSNVSATSKPYKRRSSVATRGGESRSSSASPQPEKRSARGLFSSSPEEFGAAPRLAVSKGVLSFPVTSKDIGRRNQDRSHDHLHAYAGENQ